MKYLVGIYGATVLIAAICFDIWGQYAYKGFFYNLGQALVWPAVVFPSFGKLLSGVIWLLVILSVLSLRSRGR
ncbi:hypothetical protein NRY95_02615 [Xanthomonas campestris pv. phormiicola]|nr:hypothetical protein [Xanthomonas translucens]MCC4598236.1 hypothetical protein [Xanthomonas campestris pv. phormiicola]UKE51172.1 hypothetical protein KCU57_01905 [Xanthomonas translucens]UYC16893.1 hypothetical protein NRY95_02615 [Xanthomonas campestris pv. phormiicola]